MKLLYVRKRILDPFWKRWPKKIRDWYFLHHYEGLFRGGIRTFATVKEVSLPGLRNLSAQRIRQYDAVIFHYQCNNEANRSSFETCREAISDFRDEFGDVPVILLVLNDHAGQIPGDRCLDQVQLVFKREPYRDLERYDLTNKNRDKIKPTVMCSPLVPATLWNRQSIEPAEYGHDSPSDQFDTDVFFLGTSTSRLRIDVVRILQESTLDFSGGLLEKQYPVPDSLRTSRLPQNQFYNQIRSSKINLALEGCGQFTYRHWELWGLSAFMLSTSSLNEIRLPFEITEGEHYVTFDDPGNLVDTIHHYLRAPKERRRIARRCRQLFEREYDFEKYGKYIEKIMQKNIL